MLMDTTLYDELGLDSTARTNMKLKSSMVASFSGQMRQGLAGILSSVDLGLSSPDLDRFLLQTDGDSIKMLTGSRPKDLSSPVLFAHEGTVTEEQEAYARGFVDALEQLHKQKGPPLAAILASTEDQQWEYTSQYSMPEHSYLLSYPNHSSNGHVHTSTVHHTASANQISSLPYQLLHSSSQSQVQVQYEPNTVVTSHCGSLERQYSDMKPMKEEPQTVPSLGSTPPHSPVDMDEQEVIKLERKRARNRMAARKCRTRKLEQITVLEVRVAELKAQNSELERASLSVREQVHHLRRELDDHVTSVCHLSHLSSHDFMMQVSSHDSYNSSLNCS